MPFFTFNMLLIQTEGWIKIYQIKSKHELGIKVRALHSEKEIRNITKRKPLLRPSVKQTSASEKNKVLQSFIGLTLLIPLQF